MINTFDGEWISSVHVYAVQITNRTGVMTLSNSLIRKTGDVILVIPEATGDSFTGRQIFADGSVYEVKGKLTDINTLVMTRAWDHVDDDAAGSTQRGSGGDRRRQHQYHARPGLRGSQRLRRPTTACLPAARSQRPGARSVVRRRVTFGDIHAAFTTATFTQAGTYVLQLAATDGEKTSTSTVTVIVH